MFKRSKYDQMSSKTKGLVTLFLQINLLNSKFLWSTEAQAFKNFNHSKYNLMSMSESFWPVIFGKKCKREPKNEFKKCSKQPLRYH